MRFLTALAFSFWLLLGSSSSAFADATASPSPSPVAIATNDVDTMLRTGHADAALFSASFLAQIPASKVDEIIGNLTTALGLYKSVEFTPGYFVAHFAKGDFNVVIHLDANNKIDGLLFRPPVAPSPSPSP